MRKETMTINGNKVEFKVTDLGYNSGDPIRNGTVVEMISPEERFCRLSDGDAGKVGLYAYHMKHNAFAAAANAYLKSLFPGMEVRYYFPDIPDSDGKRPSPPVLYKVGIGPSEDGKSLYIDNIVMDDKFMKRWSLVWRYWTSHNICKEEGVKFLFDNLSGGSGAPELYEHKATKMIRVRDAGFNSSIREQEYFRQLLELIDQLKGED